MAKKRYVALLFLSRCSYVLIYIAAFFVLTQNVCFVKIMTSRFITCSLFKRQGAFINLNFFTLQHRFYI